MICFGKESEITLEEYKSRCEASPEISKIISQLSCSVCREIPDIIEVIQKEPVDLGHSIMSHERYIGRNLVTVPGEIQQADWINMLRAGEHATHILVLFAMHESVNIPVAEFGKLTVTDNHMNYEQACMINEDETIQRIHHDKGTQDSCWIHKSDLDQTQGIFYQQCICCRAVFDGVNTVSLLPPAPVPAYDDNIDWMQTEDADSEFASGSEDEMENEEILYHEWKNNVIDSIVHQHEDVAIVHLAMLHSEHRTLGSLADDYVSFMILAIFENSTRVFDYIVGKYMHMLQTRIVFGVQHNSLHRQNSMRKCLHYAVKTMHDEVVLASTLKHIIYSNMFCPDYEVWKNVFASLFKLLDSDLLRQGTEIVLSKFEILLCHEITPLSTNPDQQYFAALDGFLEWCVCTSANTATFANGFESIVAATMRFHGADFSMNLLCTLEKILLICRNKQQVSGPRVPLIIFSEEKISTILRMLQYYQGYMVHLIFPMNTCNEEGRNAFFYITNPEIMKFLFSKGVDPAQRDENGETALFFILNRVCQDCRQFEQTQAQADELYSCISQLLLYRVGLEDTSLAAASSLVKTLVFHRPVFERLEILFEEVRLREA